MKVTLLQYRSRFTEAEKVGIELAASDDPSAPMPQRVLAATLRVYLADLAAVKEQMVDLTDPKHLAGLTKLEQAGLLAQGRAAEILALPAEQWPPVGGFALGQKVRLLAPFDAVFPGEHEIVGFGAESVLISEGREFALHYVEAV